MAAPTTIPEAQAAYTANADYEEVESAAKARAFITACRALIGLVPSESANGSERSRQDANIAAWEKQIAAARRWLAEVGNADTCGGGPNASTSYSLECSRG
jgi:hypothetical protein